MFKQPAEEMDIFFVYFRTDIITVFCLGLMFGKLLFSASEFSFVFAQGSL